MDGEPGADVETSVKKQAGEVSVGHMELIGHVARWKRHLIKLIDIPACEEQPPRSRVGPDCFHQLGDLVVAFFLATVKISFDQFIARPIHPLSAIDGAKLTPFLYEILIFLDITFELNPT